MTQSDPDYSLYNLEQLYDIYRHLDKRRFPERAATVRQQIVLKEGIVPVMHYHPPCQLLRFLGAKPSRKNYHPNKALRTARIIVELEYGAFAFFVVLPTVLFSGSFILLSFIIWSAIYLLTFSGVAILRKRLGAVKDKCIVELWSLIALGAAPFSAILYTFIAGYAADQMTFYYNGILLTALFLMPFVGFYTPFVLAVFWVKYHCREDEF